jgi:hypothetical protein
MKSNGGPHAKTQIKSGLTQSRKAAKKIKSFYIKSFFLAVLGVFAALREKCFSPLTFR